MGFGLANLKSLHAFVGIYKHSYIASLIRESSSAPGLYNGPNRSSQISNLYRVEHANKQTYTNASCLLLGKSCMSILSLLSCLRFYVENWYRQLPNLISQSFGCAINLSSPWTIEFYLIPTLAKKKLIKQLSQLMRIQLWNGRHGNRCSKLLPSHIDARVATARMRVPGCRGAARRWAARRRGATEHLCVLQQCSCVLVTSNRRGNACDSRLALDV